MAFLCSNFEYSLKNPQKFIKVEIKIWLYKWGMQTRVRQLNPILCHASPLIMLKATRIPYVLPSREPIFSHFQPISVFKSWQRCL